MARQARPTWSVCFPSCDQNIQWARRIERYAAEKLTLDLIGQNVRKFELRSSFFQCGKNLPLWPWRAGQGEPCIYKLLAAHYASCHVGQQQRLSTVVCFGVAVSGWCLMCASMSSFHSQVFFGLPVLFSSGVQWKATHETFLCSLLRTCPVHFHLLFNRMASIFSCLHLISSSSFVILFDQKLHRILQRFFACKIDSLFR